MRIIGAFIVMVLMSTITIVLWYVTQPVVYSFLDFTYPMLTGQQLTLWQELSNMLRFFMNIWGVVFCGLYMLWFTINAIREKMVGIYV